MPYLRRKALKDGRIFSDYNIQKELTYPFNVNLHLHSRVDHLLTISITSSQNFRQHHAHTLLCTIFAGKQLQHSHIHYWLPLPQSKYVKISTSKTITLEVESSDTDDDEPSGYLAMYFSNLTSFEQSREDVTQL